MKISGRTMMKSSLAIEDRIAALKECGYDEIELCFGNENAQFVPEFVKKGYAEYILECCKKVDIEIECISYHCGYVFDDERFSQLKTAIEAVTYYGVNTLIICNSVKRWECNQEEDWNTFIERTKELVALAEKTGITLAMEFEPSMVCGDTAGLHKMLEAIPSDNLMVNLDLGHVFLCDPEPMEAIKSLKGKVAHAHIENMSRGVHYHLPPHLGDMDLQEYVDALKEIGFDGAMSLDLYAFDYFEQSKMAIPMIKAMF